MAVSIEGMNFLQAPSFRYSVNNGAITTFISTSLLYNLAGFVIRPDKITFYYVVVQ